MHRTLVVVTTLLALGSLARAQTKVYPENMALVGTKIGAALNTAGWSKDFQGVADKTMDAWSKAEKAGTGAGKSEWVRYDKGPRPLLDFMPNAWGQFQRTDGKRVVSERTIRVDPRQNYASVSVMEFAGPHSKGIVLTPTRWTYLTTSPGQTHLLQRDRRADGAIVERQLEGRRAGQIFRKPLVLEKRTRSTELGQQRQVKLGYRLRIGSRAFVPLPRFIGRRIENRLDRRAATTGR